MRTIACVLLAIAPWAPSQTCAAELTGINLAGGEFGGPDGRYGYKYVYPDARAMAPFRAQGMNVFRVPMRWERLQPAPGGALAAVELARIDAVAAAAARSGASVILDIHNYGRYRRQSIGTPGVPARNFVSFWERLARRYRGNSSVIFGMMNEPVDIPAPAWARIAQDTVDAIRAAGARNLILVPGTRWSGAHSWRKAPPGGVSNATAMAGLRDPADNVAFDFHQYFDAHSSGQGLDCVSLAEAQARLKIASDWLRETGRRGFLSEFGVGRSAPCLAVLKGILSSLDSDRRWLGWTIWASSPWFGSYAFNLHPSTAPPQLAVLKPFLARPGL